MIGYVIDQRASNVFGPKAPFCTQFVKPKFCGSCIRRNSGALPAAAISLALARRLLAK